MGNSRLNTIKILAFVFAAMMLAGCASAPVGAEKKSPPSPAHEEQNLSTDEIHHRCYGYIYGEEGLPLDYAQANKWCKRAAEIPGNTSGITLLAELNLHGQGTPVNYEEAARLYRMAAEQGHPHAQLEMAALYFLGHGVEKNQEEGMRWLRMSADQGYERAIDLLNKFKEVQ